MGGIKGGMVEGVKRAKEKGRWEIKRKIDGKSEKWNIGQRSEMGGRKKGRNGRGSEGGGGKGTRGN